MRQDDGRNRLRAGQARAEQTAAEQAEAAQAEAAQAEAEWSRTGRAKTGQTGTGRSGTERSRTRLAGNGPAEATEPGGAERPGAGHVPIRDYAVLGDCHGAALVSREGSVDWCCLGRFDADPVLCGILDSRRGGVFQIRPAGAFEAERSYLGDTNVLRTRFTTAQGTVTVTDFMPVGRRTLAGTHNYVDLNAPHWLIRMIDCEGGEVPVDIRYRPTAGFGARATALRLQPGLARGDDGTCLYHDLPDLGLQGGEAVARVTLAPGTRHVLVMTQAPVARGDPLARAERMLRVTCAFWEEWIGYCRYDGAHRAAVRRSALTLKLLTYAPTGAIVAAPTSSLPEEIGGVRNWDYRFCWLRDAVFGLHALASLGYSGEARRFGAYMTRACAATFPEVRIMYGIGHEHDLPEAELDHLSGYRGSAPVRRGNGAHRQRQIDVYGEVLDWALLHRTLGGRFDRRSRRMLAALADFVRDHWHEPDQGLWEIRGPARHHVHGKMMSWVALDRAARLMPRRERWSGARDAIARDVHENGIDPATGAFVQAYGTRRVDAALLAAPMLDFPAERATLQATVDAVARDLGQGRYLRRYLDDDGLPGAEGAFLLCSFWMVDALLCVGRRDAARSLFDALCAGSNDVGLYAEQADPDDDAFLGNFPQALSHLGLIAAALHLELEARQGPEALRGTHADRTHRIVSATMGWRGLWAAFRMTRTVRRILPSRRSKLPRRLWGG